MLDLISLITFLVFTSYWLASSACRKTYAIVKKLSERNNVDEVYGHVNTDGGNAQRNEDSGGKKSLTNGIFKHTESKLEDYPEQEDPARMQEEVHQGKQEAGNLVQLPVQVKDPKAYDNSNSNPHEKQSQDTKTLTKKSDSLQLYSLQDIINNEQNYKDYLKSKLTNNTNQSPPNSNIKRQQEAQSQHQPQSSQNPNPNSQPLANQPTSIHTSPKGPQDDESMNRYQSQDKMKSSTHLSIMPNINYRSLRPYQYQRQSSSNQLTEHHTDKMRDVDIGDGQSGSAGQGVQNDKEARVLIKNKDTQSLLQIPRVGSSPTINRVLQVKFDKTPQSKQPQAQAVEHPQASPQIQPSLGSANELNYAMIHSSSNLNLQKSQHKLSVAQSEDKNTKNPQPINILKQISSKDAEEDKVEELIYEEDKELEVNREIDQRDREQSPERRGIPRLIISPQKAETQDNNILSSQLKSYPQNQQQQLQQQPEQQQDQQISKQQALQLQRLLQQQNYRKQTETDREKSQLEIIQALRDRQGSVNASYEGIGEAIDDGYGRHLSGTAENNMDGDGRINKIDKITHEIDWLFLNDPDKFMEIINKYKIQQSKNTPAISPPTISIPVDNSNLSQQALVPQIITPKNPPTPQQHLSSLTDSTRLQYYQALLTQTSEQKDHLEIQLSEYRFALEKKDEQVEELKVRNYANEEKMIQLEEEVFSVKSLYEELKASLNDRVEIEVDRRIRGLGGNNTNNSNKPANQVNTAHSKSQEQYSQQLLKIIDKLQRQSEVNQQKLINMQQELYKQFQKNKQLQQKYQLLYYEFNNSCNNFKKNKMTPQNGTGPNIHNSQANSQYNSHNNSIHVQTQGFEDKLEKELMEQQDREGKNYQLHGESIDVISQWVQKDKVEGNGNGKKDSVKYQQRKEFVEESTQTDGQYPKLQGNQVIIPNNNTNQQLQLSNLVKNLSPKSGALLRSTLTNPQQTPLTSVNPPNIISLNLTIKSLANLNENLRKQLEQLQKQQFITKKQYSSLKNKYEELLAKQKMQEEELEAARKQASVSLEEKEKQIQRQREEVIRSLTSQSPNKVKSPKNKNINLNRSLNSDAVKSHSANKIPIDGSKTDRDMEDTEMEKEIKNLNISVGRMQKELQRSQMFINELREQRNKYINLYEDLIQKNSEQQIKNRQSYIKPNKVKPQAQDVQIQTQFPLKTTYLQPLAQQEVQPRKKSSSLFQYQKSLQKQKLLGKQNPLSSAQSSRVKVADPELINQLEQNQRKLEIEQYKNKRLEEQFNIKEQEYVDKLEQFQREIGKIRKEAIDDKKKYNEELVAIRVKLRENQSEKERLLLMYKDMEAAREKDIKERESRKVDGMKNSLNASGTNVNPANKKQLKIRVSSDQSPPSNPKAITLQQQQNQKQQSPIYQQISTGQNLAQSSTSNPAYQAQLQQSLSRLNQTNQNLKYQIQFAQTQIRMLQQNEINYLEQIGQLEQILEEFREAGVEAKDPGVEIRDLRDKVAKMQPIVGEYEKMHRKYCEMKVKYEKLALERERERSRERRLNRQSFQSQQAKNKSTHTPRNNHHAPTPLFGSSGTIPAKSPRQQQLKKLLTSNQHQSYNHLNNSDKKYSMNFNMNLNKIGNSMSPVSVVSGGLSSPSSMHSNSYVQENSNSAIYTYQNYSLNQKSSVLGHNRFLFDCGFISEYEKIFVYDTLKSLLKGVLKTQKLYNSISNRSKNPHDLIDNLRGILTLIQLQNNKILGAYTHQCFSSLYPHSTPQNIAFLMDISNHRSFTNQSGLNSINYNSNSLVWGFSEIMLKHDEPQVLYTNFCRNHNIYWDGKYKIEEFIGQEKQWARIVQYEIFRVVKI